MSFDQMMTVRQAGRHVRILAFLSLLLVAGGCARGGSPQAPTQGPSPVAAVLSVTIEGAEFTWTPSTVTVQPGQRVRLRIVNKGGVAHNFASDPAGIPETSEIPAGGERTVEWTAPSRGGSLEFWCSVPGHREAGMVGTIMVK